MGLFQSIKLTKDQFLYLEKKHYAGLVFQFFYPKSSPNGSPTLIVYAMLKGHKKISDDAFKIMEYDLNSKPENITDDHYLGSLQVKKTEIEKLLKDSNKPDPYKFDFFLFTPKHDTVSNYVIYDISVVPSNQQLLAKTLPANPSPPASAFS